MPEKRHRETHLVGRVGWLRAAVLGANDGIVSTASVIVGVAAAATDKPEILVAGVASLAAGAMSMAAGEYVSVSSQADTEQAEVARERREQRDDPEGERAELREIYIHRGLEPKLAAQVAEQLMRADPLGAHVRDELGINEFTTARPIQAAMVSAATFASGAALPLLMAAALPQRLLTPGVGMATLAALVLLGALGARAGGADMVRGALRVAFWGALAMAATWGVGALFGTIV